MKHTSSDTMFATKNHGSANVDYMPSARASHSQIKNAYAAWLERRKAAGKTVCVGQPKKFRYEKGK